MDSSEESGSDLEWAENLGRYNSVSARVPEGEGWGTMLEIIKKSPYGNNKTRRVMSELVKKGAAEAFSGYIVNESGFTVRQIWYRIKL